MKERTRKHLVTIIMKRNVCTIHLILISLILVLPSFDVLAQSCEREHPDKRTSPTTPFSRHPNIAPQRLDDLTEEELWAPGEILVGFESGASPAAIDEIHAELGAERLNGFRTVNVQLVKLPESMSVGEAVKRYESMPGIRFAEPNYRLFLCGDRVPDDTLFSKQWALYNRKYNEYDINILKAWGITKGSRDVVVAVVDTGIACTHPDLENNIWANLAELNGVDGVDDDGNGYVDDVHGYDFGDKDSDPNPISASLYHGTHVAGTIGAEGDNGIGVSGVCQEVSLMAVKIAETVGFIYLSWAIEGIEYGGSMGASVFNCSWGSILYSKALYEAMAAQEGLFICSAGNSVADMDLFPFYPAGYDLDNVISVGAIDLRGRTAFFSNYGMEGVDIMAPGHEILSLWTFPVAGSNTYDYQMLSGTSMAAPHVAGVAALLLSKYPELSTEELVNRICCGAKYHGYNCTTGGLLDAYGALTCFSKTKTGPLTVNITSSDAVAAGALWRWHGSNRWYRSGETAEGAPYGKVTIVGKRLIKKDYLSVPKVRSSFTKGGVNQPLELEYYKAWPPSGSQYYAEVSEGGFEDITETGRKLPYPETKAMSHPLNLGFNFEYFGKTYNKFWVSEWGEINTSKNGWDKGPRIMPFSAPLLRFRPDAAVIFEVKGAAPDRRAIVQWNGFFYSLGMPTRKVKIQAKLFERDGSIEFCYDYPWFLLWDSYQLTHIGLWGDAGQKQISFNLTHRRIISDNLRIRFARSDSGFASPVPISLKPKRSAGEKKLLRAVFSCPEGAGSIKRACIALPFFHQSAITPLITYDADSNMIYLNDEHSNTWRGGGALGSGKVLENIMLKVDLAQTSVERSGDLFTLVAPVEFKPGFNNWRSNDIYLAAEDRSGRFSGYRKTGHIRSTTPSEIDRSLSFTHKISTEKGKEGPSAEFSFHIRNKDGIGELEFLEVRVFPAADAVGYAVADYSYYFLADLLVIASGIDEKWSWGYPGEPVTIHLGSMTCDYRNIVKEVGRNDLKLTIPVQFSPAMIGEWRIVMCCKGVYDEVVKEKVIVIE